MVQIGFWLFCMVCALAVPGTMIGFGRRWEQRPPESVNSWYGYRTARSMKNQDTWRFAHAVCGKIWRRAGWALLILSAAVMAAALPLDIDPMSYTLMGVCLVQCAVMCGTLIPVERALKRTFDRDGRRL